MSLFRLDASINPDSSASRAIADIVESEWLAEVAGLMLASSRNRVMTMSSRVNCGRRAASLV